jgi:hypothetical protein
MGTILHSTVKGIFLFSLFLFSLPLSAQTSKSFNETEVIEKSKQQLDALVAPDGELNRYFRKKNVTGNFVFDITLQGKGDVITVFMVSAHPEGVQPNNIFKDKLYTLKLTDVKIPKKARVKFRHSLTI